VTRRPSPPRTGRPSRPATRRTPANPRAVGAGLHPAGERSGPRRRRRVKLGDPQRRLRAAAVVIFFVLSLFAGRLVQLQAIDASAYAATASQERLRSVTVPATRGTITDANGVALATSVDAWTITADQTQVTDPYAEAKALDPLLPEDVMTLQDRLTGTSNFSYISQQVSPRTYHRVMALRLAGIYAEPTSKRVYPQGNLAANVVGFVGFDGHGLGGYEASLDGELAGRDGHLTYEAGAGGQEIPAADNDSSQPVPGSNITLTINSDIQFIAERAIARKVRESGAQSGSVVVMDPHTGQVLAMATYPRFNPANPEAAPGADRGNRVVSEIYEPGSTSKVMTMAAALQAGVVTPDTHITVPSVLYRGGRGFHDDIPHGVWHLTTTGVLARSSNMGTMLIAEKLGEQRLYDALKRFGIADPTGLDFPGESAGLLADVSAWGPTNFATIAFGQGLSLNALQATSVFATIANDGVRVQPSLIKSTTAPDGTVTPAPAPAATRVVGAKAATALRGMMEAVVSDQGTAPQAEIPGYRVAGKTGTAQRVDPSCGCYRGYTASFIGMAPADKPALVVSVTLQRPVYGHYGGMLGGPVFKRVMSFALQAQGIPPTGRKPPKMTLTW
jgi:cell division protein FtsI (penicillin-binding protein 3)